MHPTVILDIRYTVIAGGHPTLEILRGMPVVDASGAVVGFVPAEEWEDVRFDEFASVDEYARARSRKEPRI